MLRESYWNLHNNTVMNILIVNLKYAYSGNKHINTLFSQIDITPNGWDFEGNDSKDFKIETTTV